MRFSLLLRAIGSIVALLLVARLIAQPPNDDCEDASTLYAQSPLSGDNTGAVGWPGYCPSTDNLVWYTFTTNSSGGVVNVDITSIDCPPIVGMDDELSVILLAGDGSCLSGSFSAVSVCSESSIDFTAASEPLLPGTQYWVIVAGAVNDGATIAAQCEFTITLSGPGVDVVGMEELAGIAGLNLTPNPVDEELMVTSSEELVYIEVYEMHGKRVLFMGSPGRSVRLPVIELPSGAYIFRASATDGRAGVVPFVKR